MPERYNRDTVELTKAQLDELTANKALDTRDEYFVTDGPYFVNATSPSQVQGAGNSGGTEIGRRAARVAAAARGPKIVAPAWSATEALVSGDVRRLASGHHVTVTAAGTTGGSAPVLSATVLDGRPIVDGTVTWYVNGAIKSASDPDAPTISGAASAAAAGLTETRFAVGDGVLPAFCITRGARAISRGTNFVGPYACAVGTTAFGANSTANAAAAGYTNDAFTTAVFGYEFDVTDSRFGITLHNSASRVTVEIEGQAVEAAPMLSTGSAGWCWVADYAGVVAKRRVRITGVAGVNPAVRGVALTAQGSVSVPEVSTDTMILLGDSHMATTVPANDSFLFHLGYWLERRLGVQELVCANVGGSGYIVANTNTYNVLGVLNSAANRAIFPLYAAKDVFINAGFNDRAGNTVSAIKVAALATWRVAREVFPSARITIGDGASGSGGPDANAIAVAAGLAEAFAEWGDPNSRFVKIVGAGGAASYVRGTGNAGQALAAGNSSVYTSTDSTHATPAWNREYASRFSADYRAAWNFA